MADIETYSVYSKTWKLKNLRITEKRLLRNRTVGRINQDEFKKFTGTVGIKMYV